jgi:hypothetical protein
VDKRKIILINMYKEFVKISLIRNLFNKQIVNVIQDETLRVQDSLSHLN